jgi:hypothetical protein
MRAGELFMPTTIQEIYTQVIRALSPSERLRLATLILNDLAQHSADVVDQVVAQSDTWTEQDQVDLVTFSLQYGASEYSEHEELAE